MAGGHLCIINNLPSWLSQREIPPPGAADVRERNTFLLICGREGAGNKCLLSLIPSYPLRFPDDGSLAEPHQKPEVRDAEWQYFTITYSEGTYREGLSFLSQSNHESRVTPNKANNNS